MSVTLTRKSLGLTAVLVCWLALQPGGSDWASGVAITDKRAVKPSVVCKQSVSGDRFLLRKRPGRCLFHQRGAPSWAGLQAIAVAERLRWSSWGPRTAVARGKLFISSVGQRQAKFLLKKPRVVCGKRVYTRLKVTNLDFGTSSSWSLTACFR